MHKLFNITEHKISWDSHILQHLQSRVVAKKILFSRGTIISWGLIPLKLVSVLFEKIPNIQKPTDTSEGDRWNMELGKQDSCFHWINDLHKQRTVICHSLKWQVVWTAFLVGVGKGLTHAWEILPRACQVFDIAVLRNNDYDAYHKPTYTTVPTINLPTLPHLPFKMKKSLPSPPY